MLEEWAKKGRNEVRERSHAEWSGPTDVGIKSSMTERLSTIVMGLGATGVGN